MDNLGIHILSKNKTNWKVYNEHKKEILTIKNKTYNEVRSMNTIKPNYIIVEDKIDE